ncbi:MAG TPA: M99 family carboxypeptidase catalytic domain-containing protein [Syntrophorhabdaceae bacterium]|nr:M99 family carboxypeptidase catalytic domain-containing protein [Syntrophorhabdaceae bacterium]
MTICRCIAVLFVLFLLLVQNSEAQEARSVQKYFSGTNQEVTVYTIKGETSGPTVLIFAGIHGDERACPVVAAKYSNIRLKKGNIVVVPRLNAVAIQKKKRNGLGGDMNRLFDQPETSKNPDVKVVNLAKELIKKADYVVNMHQGHGFYSPTWINSRRNPSRWGQSNVVDAPYFDLPNGDKLELEKFANKVVQRSNENITDRRFHFQVNNTNTGSEDSRHKVQRKSLTYYAVTKEHKHAIAIEVTKNCTFAQATTYLVIALNAVINETGIVAEKLP